MQGVSSVFSEGSEMHRHLSVVLHRGVKKAPGRTTFLFVLAIFVGAFISIRLIDSTMTSNKSTKGIVSSKTVLQLGTHQKPVATRRPKRPSYEPYKPLSCASSLGNLTVSCSIQDPIPTVDNLSSDDIEPESPSCPEFFRWIHEDLRPWKASGITKEMVQRAKRTATFRLVVLSGRVYVEKYQKPYQTRDVFTIWGILQLVRLYPGQLPDLELMFDCVDWPVVMSRNYRGSNASAPPPLFRYCGDDHTLDIVFPDWSFWGWAEINVRPWQYLLKELKQGNERSKWMDREPYAYWKGNPFVAETRQDLLKCNVSEVQDWNARLFVQDWIKESQHGFKQSDLASQCNYRYKIYIEGSAWSVSEKYILACDSPTLLVKPHYYDFFTRGLMPVHHYWPIREDDKCRSIKFAVDWGNSHKQKAQAIGKAASSFIQEDLKMENVYDYMFHLLREYAKLLKYKPTKPKNAVEICPESMVCPSSGFEKKFLEESMVKEPRASSPCTLPQPFSPAVLQKILRRKNNSIKQVEIWEQQARNGQHKKI